MRQIAEEDAKNVVGVAWTTNNICVRADQRADWAIADDIDFNLITDSVLDRFDIDTNVKDGVATWEGDVNKSDQRRKAGDLALRTTGISEVDNRLTVKGVDYPWNEYHYK